jgi:predicted lipoprotein with Yx(FWY)xxD motif
MQSKRFHLNIRTTMLLAIGILAAASLVAAACSSGDDATPLPGTPASAASAGSGATVLVRKDSKFGQVLTTPDGLPLYTFNGDTPGKSNCTGDCLEEWPAFTTDASTVPPVAGVPGAFSVVTRDDGKMQVAYNGLPLYTFKDDNRGGAPTGDGEDGFKVAAAAGATPTAGATSSSDAGAAGGGYNY